ncbi:hypothetical protein [Jannaschia sp. CCS1]|uniref:hypothetical protein n=1 Tax=Jannaschia sp. (strain CCS1) TaxID=290400 RepID=UPI0005C65C10|nr:hypothetical protein [Jannaschia sp. CCS1]
MTREQLCCLHGKKLIGMVQIDFPKAAVGAVDANGNYVRDLILDWVVSAAACLKVRMSLRAAA